MKHVAFEKALEVFLVALLCCTRAVQYSTVRARAFSGVFLVDAPRRRLRRALLSRVAWLQLHPHHLISSHQIRAMHRTAQHIINISAAVPRDAQITNLNLSVHICFHVEKNNNYNLPVPSLRVPSRPIPCRLERETNTSKTSRRSTRYIHIPAFSSAFSLFFCRFQHFPPNSFY